MTRKAGMPRIRSISIVVGISLIACCMAIPATALAVPEFEAEKVPTPFKVKQTGNHVFTFLEKAKGAGAGKVICSEAEAAGETKAKRQPLLVVIPSYAKCVWYNKKEVEEFEKFEGPPPGQGAVEVKTKGCGYVLQIEPGQKEKEAGYIGELMLMPACEVSFEKFAGVPACKVTIKGAPGLLKASKYLNEPIGGGPPYTGMKLIINVPEGISYESAGCPAGFSKALQPWAVYNGAFDFSKTGITVS